MDVYVVREGMERGKGRYLCRLTWHFEQRRASHYSFEAASALARSHSGRIVRLKPRKPKTAAKESVEWSPVKAFKDYAPEKFQERYDSIGRLTGVYFTDNDGTVVSVSLCRTVDDEVVRGYNIMRKLLDDVGTDASCSLHSETDYLNFFLTSFGAIVGIHASYAISFGYADEDVYVNGKRMMRDEAVHELRKLAFPLP